jgi:hypothetical protein
MVWILLTSLIWWDYPNIFNHISFPYIKRDLSWKRLSKKKQSKANIVWRVLHWIILESLISVHQVIVEFFHSILEQVCGLEQRVIERGPCEIKALVVVSAFTLI